MNATSLRTRIMGTAMLRRVVTALAFVLASAFAPLVAVGPVGAQSAPLCTRFEAGPAGQDNWGACTGAPNIVVTTKDAGSIGGAGDYYLHLRDTSGPSAACSMDQKYLGDWVQKMGGCGQFCFDFKLFKSGTPPASVHPSFSIYNGTMRAVFVANVVLTSADPWEQHICAPVNLIQNGDNLPSNGSGEWRVADSGGVFSNAYSPDWNTIITGVTMIAFPVDFTSDPSEEVGYDNLCMNPGNCEEPHEPKVSGCLKDSRVEVDCNPDGTYTLTLDSSSFTGDDITLTSETPGVTVATAQQPWSATTTWTLVGATPGQTVVLRANTTQIGGGSEKGTDLCCSGEITIVMPECPPIIDVTIGKENTPEGAGGAGFNIWVTNLGAPITFLPGELVVTDVIPPGMDVTGITAPNWTCNPTSLVGPGTITCTYNLAGSLPTNASLSDAIVIHDTITDHEQPLKNCAQIAIASPVGLDSNPFNNEACVEVTDRPEPKIDVAIEKTGEYVPLGDMPPPGSSNLWFSLAVTNVGAAFTGANTIIVTDLVPAGMTFNTATGTDWTCDAPPTIPAGGMLTCTYTGVGPTGPGASLGTITIGALTTVNGPWENCAEVGVTAGVDTNPDDNKDCVEVTAPDQEIDLAIEKTGATSPAQQVNAYAFHLTVTNMGSPFNGTNIVAITDFVPSGMEFTSATGADWTCDAPPTIPAGGMLTCTYIGTGPTSTGQILGTIDISATATGSPPFQDFTQCAAVGLTTSSGLVDWNPMNDEDCVTVAKPPILVCDPATAKPNAGGCSCLYPRMEKKSPFSCGCPNGTSLVDGKGCVAELTCKAPLISNSKATACVCAGRLVWNGKTCVKPLPKPQIELPDVRELPKPQIELPDVRELPKPQITLPDVRELLPKGGFGLPQEKTRP